MNRDIKSCPFCGSDGELLELDSGASFLVGCANRASTCAIGPFIMRKLQDQALSDWNYRVREECIEGSDGVPLPGKENRAQWG